MAFTRKDFEQVALAIRTKDKVEIGGREFFLDRQSRYMTALLMRDYFAMRDKMFDGLAFLRLCGF